MKRKTTMFTSFDNSPKITVAIKPRARFSCTEIGVESLLSNTTLPFKLIYLDGNSPKQKRDWLQKKLGQRPDTKLLRYDYYLGPLLAYNIVFEQADTEYVLIADNDVYFQPDWLENLYRCAEETRADVVMPLVMIGETDSQTIHVAGGDFRFIKNEDGHNILIREQRWENYQLDEVADKLRREPTELLELHCLLFRTDFAKQLGKLDETVGQMCETHVISSLCQEAGAKMMFEPSSRVSFLWGNKVGLSWSDLPFWNLAWSEKWARRQIRWTHEKYNLSGLHVNDKQVFGWLHYHRGMFLLGLLEANNRFFARLHLKPLSRLINKAITLTEVGFNNLLVEWLRHRKSARMLSFTPSPVTAATEKVLEPVAR